jgi:hypothetical protein
MKRTLHNGCLMFAIFWSVAIVLFSTISRPILNRLREFSGFLELLQFTSYFIPIAGLFGIAIFSINWSYNKKILQGILSVSLWLLYIIVSLSQLTIVEERFHIFLFGILGFSFFFTFLLYPYPIFTTLSAGASVAFVDELVQAFLPGRIGDFWDGVINLIGVLSGFWLASIYSRFQDV